MEEITITPSPQDFWKLRAAGFRDRLGLCNLTVEPSGEAHKYSGVARWLYSQKWLDTEKHLSLDDIWFKDEKRQKAWKRKVDKLRVKLPLDHYEKYITALRKTKVEGLDKLLLFLALKELPRLREKLPEVNIQLRCHEKLEELRCHEGSEYYEEYKDQILHKLWHDEVLRYDAEFRNYQEVYAGRLYDLIRDENPKISDRKIYHCIGLVFYISGIEYGDGARERFRPINPFSQEKRGCVLNPFSPKYDEPQKMKGEKTPKSKDSDKLINSIAGIFTNMRKKEKRLIKKMREKLSIQTQVWLL